MNSRIYQFQFTAPLHISNARADYGKSHTYLHSDSLLAAVMDVWAKIGCAEWIDEFANLSKQDVSKTPLVFTGAYPYDASESKPLYFFPKPYYLPPAEKKNAEPGDAKKFKKMEWLVWDAFLDILKGKPSVNSKAIHGKFYTGKEDGFIAPFNSAVQARVKRPRDQSEDAVPYYVERLFFREKCGLFTIVIATDDIWQKRCETAFTVLQHLGLGTDRAIGNGQFGLTTDTFSWPELPDSDYYVSMGLYGPQSAEDLTKEISDAACFDTLKRGGWLGEPFNTYRKKSVYMFKEGSVLKLGKSASRIKGTLFDLQPDIIGKEHPVYRSGVAFFLPVTVIENK